MKALSFALGCPSCGSELVLEASSPSRFQREHKAVVRCTKRGCLHRFIITAQIAYADVSDDGEPTICGTPAGHQRHRRAGEKPCSECEVAHAQRQQSPDALAKRRAANASKREAAFA